MIKKLNYSELRNFCDIATIEELKNNNIPKNDEIIGQNIALETLKFGLSIKNKYYNIYVSGSTGVGKTTFSKKYAMENAKNEKVPDDLLYLYNFENPMSPKSIFLPAGKGNIFKSEIDELVHTLSVELPNIFSSTSHEDEKDDIIKTYNAQKDFILKEITDYAISKGFSMKITENGIGFVPIVKGVTLSVEEFESLSVSKRDKLTKQSDELEEHAIEIIKIIRNIDKKLRKHIENIEYNLALLTVGNYMNKLQTSYKDNKDISAYLVNLKEDILENINSFVDTGVEENDINAILGMPYQKKTPEEKFSKYGVNLVVDNSKLTTAPVITTYNPSYTNLVGEIEFESDSSSFTTDYMKIKAGLFHKANGGYLILHIEDILKNPFSLETIIRVLKSGMVSIEPLKESQISSISVASIEPQQTPVNIKFIIIGSRYYHDVLYEYDESFLKYFKIHSIFDYEMDNNKENISNLIGFIEKIEEKYNTLKFDITAIKELAEYSTRLSGKKDKLTTNFNKIEEILIEANTWACTDNKNNSNLITHEHIKKAINKRIEFSSIYEKKLENMIMNNEILIKTDGLAIGEINGLAVLDYGDFCFGKPSKITATTYIGKSGVIDIENESKLGGNIHTKGIQVITGYLGKTYGNNFPLSFSCKVCFEQNYSGVDGDSASSTELYAIISSLSEIPIKQSIAVTGSVNQMGEIQPIGGVNEKIEGFFEICKKRGLTGDQGVIIPIQNVSDLSLNDSVIEAVSKNMFCIYAIENINDGIEILTGKKAGILGKNGEFSKNSVHDKSMKKLKSFYLKLKSN